jgi:tetratricopeptide (TPR) repeat protein
MQTYEAGKLIEEARGYRDLGLYQEAEAVLREVMANSPDGRDCAQGRLVFLLHGVCRYEEAAALGTDLIERGIFVYETIITTVIALNDLGRIEEARDALRLVEKCGHPLSDDAYQMACFASRLGEFPEAVRWLAFEFRRSTDYHARAFDDSDLQPLWSWLSAHEPRLDEAHAFIEIPFKEVSTAALDQNAPVVLSADDLNALNERERRLFRFDFNVGYFLPSASAIADDPGVYAQVVRLRRERLKLADRQVRAAHERAAEVVLDAQPRYIAEQARWRNHFGARLHILWALRFKPPLMFEILNLPNLELMQPLLFEILETDTADKGFRDRMDEVAELAKTDFEGARDLLEETPEAVRDTGMYRVQLGGLLKAERRYAEALPLWLDLCRLWPSDASGYSNAVTCLLELGRRDEASILLKHSPACYRRFGFYWRQLAQIEGGEPEYQAAPFRSFRGQPEHWGFLIPEAEMEPGDIPIQPGHIL